MFPIGLWIRRCFSGGLGLGFFKKLFSRGPVQDQYNAYTKEGDSFMESGDPGSAAECYANAIEMKIHGDKVDFIMHYKRGQAFEAMGELGGRHPCTSPEEA